LESGFSAEDFMREYDELSQRFEKTHSTEDYVARHGLSEKYGIDFADFRTYRQIYEMQHSTSNADGMVLGRVPAAEIDALLSKGDFPGVLSAMREGLSMDSLNNLHLLVDVKDGVVSAETRELLSWMPELAKLGGSKASDTLLSWYGLYRDGDYYVVRADRQSVQQAMLNPSMRSGLMYALQDIHDQVKGTSIEQAKQATIRERQSSMRQAERDLFFEESIDMSTVLARQEPSQNRTERLNALDMASNFFEDAMKESEGVSESRGLRV